MLSIRSLVAKNKEITPEELNEAKISMAFFNQALEKVKPISRSDLGRYPKVAEDYVYVR
jgi:transitional endoplasmic reticulum ATPase